MPIRQEEQETGRMRLDRGRLRRVGACQRIDEHQIGMPASRRAGPPELAPPSRQSGQSGWERPLTPTRGSDTVPPGRR